MDITSLNFLEKLPEISETIRECDFIAIDTELSGLMRGRNNHRYDLPEERFAKMVDSSRGYFIMQFGLSCFTQVGPLNYKNKTYNFYIFPQANQCHGDIDRTFSLQAHAIQFLSEHGFDFNKLFKHGVSYLTFQEKKAVTAQLKSESRERANVEMNPITQLPTFVPSQMIDNCSDWLRETKEFVDLSRLKNAVSRRTNNDGDSEMVTSDSELDRLKLKNCATAHKRAIAKRLLECQPFFENILVTTVTDPKTEETFLAIDFIDKKLKEERQKDSLIIAKGFLEVLELVIVNKKPLVGHNLALDLLQIINQFIKPLTSDYNTFKEICHSMFPLIYDTKYIAHTILDPGTLTNNQSRLNDMYCQLQEHETFPKIFVDHSGQFIDEKQIPHQAGYDAFMSGYCFLSLCEGYMKEKRKYKFKREDPDTKPQPIVHDHQIVTDLSNKIHLSYSYDLKFYDLANDEEVPDRNHVFYTEFPHTWQLDDLFQLFKNHGGVYVDRLNKTSALCALRDCKQIKGVLEEAKRLENSNSSYKIFTYEAYMHNIKPKKRRENGDESIEYYDAQH